MDPKHESSYLLLFCIKEDDEGRRSTFHFCLGRKKSMARDLSKTPAVASGFGFQNFAHPPCFISSYIK